MQSDPDRRTTGLPARPVRSFPPAGTLLRRLEPAAWWRAFGPAQEGSAAVEMALVLPFAILLLFGVIQFGALFFLQNTMTQVANDVVRRIAVGELSDADAATLAAARLASWNATFTILVDEPAAGDVRLSVSVPIDDAAIIDFGHFLGDGTLSAQATMRKET